MEPESNEFSNSRHCSHGSVAQFVERRTSNPNVISIFPLLNVAVFIQFWDFLVWRLLKGSVHKRVSLFSEIKIEGNEIMCQCKK